MKNLLIKDKNRRNQYLLLEKKKKILKTLIHDLSFKKKNRQVFYKKLLKYPTDTSITKIKNRCVISNRSKSNYRGFRISRIVFRNFALNDKLMGVKKSSW